VTTRASLSQSAVDPLRSLRDERGAASCRRATGRARIDREAMMRHPLRFAASVVAALVVFSAGFAAGQHHAPSGDERVEQKLLASIDLAKAVESMGDRELRLSHVTIAPGGHIGLHSHVDDPTVVYLVSGVLTNHHEDGATEELAAGQAFAEFGPMSHWVENRGASPATFVFASVSRRR
jgi:quercetin dioxygenase-like cupin family protein